jgi:peptide deformylase
MFRLSNMHRLATKSAVSVSKEMNKIAALGFVTAAKNRVPDVDFEPATSPRTAIVSDLQGNKIAVSKVADHLHQALDRACAAHHSDRGVLSAPMLGYNARVVAVHSGLERMVMINPHVVIVSRQLIHEWAQEGPEMYRVARHRSVAVRYTTIDGDEETWYAMPLEESEALQRQIDALDGVSAAERVAPCVAEEPELYPEAVHSGLVSSVPETIFKMHEKYLKRLVEPVPRAKVITTGA